MAAGLLGKHDGFRSLVDHLEGVAIWTVSEHGTFGYLSTGFEDIWGIPPEVVERDVSRLIEAIHPEDREYVRSRITQPPEAVSAESYEARVVRPDGEIRWVQARQFPIWDDNGNLTEIVGSSVDITEQKNREHELAALNRILRHDIRNDVSVMLGWVEMLEEHVDEDGTDYLHGISTAGNHILELTDVAGDYAETVTTGDALDLKPVALRSILRKEIDFRRESFPEVTFTVEGEIPDVDVRANEMLSSVFKNLLNNAVQHNDLGDPVVEISCDRRDNTAIIRIADNGPGISDTRKERIFGEGQKGIGSSGTGIGLFLVRTLVDQYGGTVRVEDNAPTGSVFIVEIPQTE